MLAWLAVIDVAVGAAFAYPEDPRDTEPGALALYFDYGRSMEGRLRRATRTDPARTAPITLAGWYDPLIAVERPAGPGTTGVTMYGMSHAVRLADALPGVAPRYRVRSVGAPGATTNWSYGAFLRDRDRRESRVAVLAIMSSTLPMILSPTPMDWNTSFAMPYTADRFAIDGSTGRLQRIAPPYDSFPEYVRTLEDTAAWEMALDRFARTDPFYDPLLVKATVLDNSVIVRLARRAWSQRRDHSWREGVLSAAGFAGNSEPVRVANAIVADFARQARADGILPVIYIVDSFGYRDQLTRSLEATLRRNRIPYLSSSQHVDPTRPNNYLPDSHFTDANDRVLAQALAELIDTHIANGTEGP
ncbi:hypothetical protein ACWPM1_13670 [Tsuneonella sp. HG249]